MIRMTLSPGAFNLIETLDNIFPFNLGWRERGLKEGGVGRVGVGQGGTGRRGRRLVVAWWGGSGSRRSKSGTNDRSDLRAFTANQIHVEKIRIAL